MSLGDSFSDTVVNGSLLLALGVAAIAGLVSFLSPCVLPLVPGYLSYVTGLTGVDLASARRGRMLLGALLFVLGFTVVFVSYGVLFGGLGTLLLREQEWITRVLGVVTIVLGLVFMGYVPGLQREWRIYRVPTLGLVGAPLLGVLFAIGWVPCIGPTLGTILTLAVDQGSAARGAVLKRCILLRARCAVRDRCDRLSPRHGNVRLGKAALHLGDASRRRDARSHRTLARDRDLGRADE